MEFIMMIGIPGSGKSYFCDKYKDNDSYVILSSDKIREEILNDVNRQDKNNEVFSTLHSRMINALSENKSVIYDATNISSKKRLQVLELIKRFDVYKRAVVVATTIEQCKLNNSLRDRKVPEEVIDRMLKNFEMVFPYEGWDKIEIYYPFPNCLWSITSDMISGKYDIEQNNRHHTLTLQKHIEKCCEIITNISDNELLRYSARLHDVGKLLTKTFKNKKGEPSEEAHYYDHENVSTYFSLFYLKGTLFSIEEQLEILFYVQKHMMAHDLKQMKEVTVNKYKSLFGEEKFNNLLKFNYADNNAK